MWLIISIILACITILILISNSIKDDKIKELEYTVGCLKGQAGYKDNDIEYKRK
ncbi:hypothetical protein K2V58_00265 [Staphylococcus arlettae]|uniref:hypothetical protein n=1 Tax=Staphylococcus arlettae TaxID=29378 RepID=UPI001E370242|nr:hypothetical protein [Staphylococcus arlettae]MCD8832740.1 hypothetical protein [Staphylococcus arlettae]